MACSKQRKVDAENRVFKQEWTDTYLFVLPADSAKPVCLICSETVALIKSSNIKRHYETKHSTFSHTYPPSSAIRSQKIADLKAQYARSSRIMVKTFTAQQRANECSLRIAWILGQHKKSFSDAMVVKECMSAVTETLLDGKQKEELCQKIQQIPLSASSATHKTQIVTRDVLAQLDEAIKKAECIGLAVDESTDRTDNAQLVVFVRFFNKEEKKMFEDLLGVATLESNTRGEDIYKAIKKMLTERGIDVRQVVSITTDGAPAMLGRERGAVARMREDHPGLISYHCIIHQSVLCAILSDQYADVMSTMMKMINFLRASSSLQHRLLREFLKEVEANADDLLLHNNVRWLSKGRVLERFWSIRKEIESFLGQLKSQKATPFLLFLRDMEKMDHVAFLVDITSHLNQLNLKLQGKDHSVCDLMTDVHAFQRKLELFKGDLQGDCTHFPAVKEQIRGDKSSFVDFVEKLITNFGKRFDSFTLGEQLSLFFQNPFLITDIRGFSKEASDTFSWANAGALQLELADLQSNVVLKGQIGGSDAASFWIQIVSETAFPTLKKAALHILSMFGSTYCCEAAFSTMNVIKNKYRSRLTNEHLDMCLRMALSSFNPRFKILAGQQVAHFSH
ncbi:unnamed protein product [Knipowitschia caucasica]